mgnify:CR=1 FL=1
MTKEEYLKIAEEQWESLEKLKSEKNFYDYEKKFDELMIGFGRELLEKNLGEVPLDRRKKKK